MCSRWSRSPLKGFDTSTSRELRLGNDANCRDRPPGLSANYDWETVRPPPAVSSSREHTRCLCRSFAMLKDDSKGTMSSHANEGSRRGRLESNQHGHGQSRKPRKNMIRQRRVVEVSNPFRGERDQREHTALRCLKTPTPTVGKRCKSVGRGLAPAAKYDRGTAGRRGIEPL